MDGTSIQGLTRVWWGGRDCSTRCCVECLSITPLSSNIHSILHACVRCGSFSTSAFTHKHSYASPFQIHVHLFSFIYLFKIVLPHLFRIVLPNLFQILLPNLFRIVLPNLIKIVLPNLFQIVLSNLFQIVFSKFIYNCFAKFISDSLAKFISKCFTKFNSDSLAKFISNCFAICSHFLFCHFFLVSVLSFLHAIRHPKLFSLPGNFF